MDKNGHELTRMDKRLQEMTISDNSQQQYFCAKKPQPLFNVVHMSAVKDVGVVVDLLFDLFTI